MAKDFDNVIEDDDFRSARNICDAAGKDETTCMSKFDDVQNLDKDLYCGMSPFKLKIDANHLAIEKKSAIKSIGRAFEKIPGVAALERKIVTKIKRDEESKRKAAARIEGRVGEKIGSCTALPIGNRADKRVV
jgi:hypothetical protein